MNPSLAGFPFKRINCIIQILILLVAGLHLFIPIYNHYCFRSYAFDYAVYNFAFYDYAHVRISACPLYLTVQPTTFLQDHFSLTLMLLTPFYWLLSWLTGTYTLIVIQWLFIIYGAWGTYQFVLLKTEDKHTAYLATFFYFTLIGRFTAAAADCNLVIIGSALMPAFLYYFEKNKILYAALLCLLLIVNREDFALGLTFMGLFLMFIHRKEPEKLKLSTLLTAFSLVMFLMIFNIVIPLVENKDNRYSLFQYNVIGKTPGEAIRYFFHDPIRFFQLLFVNHDYTHLFNNVKAEFYLVYILSGGFILLWRPAFIIPFIPLLAKKMYNDLPMRWSFESYYSIEVVSILPVMCFWALTALKSVTTRLSISWIIVCCTITVTIFEITYVAGIHNGVKGDIRKYNFLSADFYEQKHNLDAVYKAMELIPSNAIVSSASGLSAHLAFRDKIYTLPTKNDATYWFYLKSPNNWPVSMADLERETKIMLEQSNWKIISESKDHCLLKKMD